ncbi:MAG: hypothetical protein HFH41_06920 [Lachnospiraceae bacterium]|nr:hypothetical protein [Lachnospiraceae bacterium]
MIRPLEETVAERRDYVNRIRESFYPREERELKYGDRRSKSSFEEEREGELKYSSLGIRTLIAILLFAAFVYCDKEQIRVAHYQTKDLYKQIEWNPLPLEKWKQLLEKKTEE